MVDKPVQLGWSRWARGLWRFFSEVAFGDTWSSMRNSAAPDRLVAVALYATPDEEAKDIAEGSLEIVRIAG
jgi:hypothetical protein